MDVNGRAGTMRCFLSHGEKPKKGGFDWGETAVLSFVFGLSMWRGPCTHGLATSMSMLASHPSVFILACITTGYCVHTTQYVLPSTWYTSSK